MPYIGNNHIAGDHTNNFKVLDDISSFTATFDGSATSVVDIANNTIRVVEHRFIQGQRVTYTNGGGGNIGGLTTGTAYFVIFDSASTIKLATNASNAANSTAINLSAVGTGSSHTLNAAFDGVNTKFKLTHGSGTGARLNNATQINVAINNVLQRPNLDPNNFTDGFALEDNHKIVFQTAPTSEDIFWGSIIANTLTTFDISDHKIDTFTGDGSTTEFTLSHTPANNESLMVTINGVLQHPSNASTSRAYTLIASIIQFTAAPGVGDEIQVRHLGFAGATTADVSGFYGRTGNVTLTANDHITTGDITARNINASGILTASSASFGGNVSIGGTLTYEDVTNIDSVGIVTAQTDVHVGAGLSVVGVSTFSNNVHVGTAVTILGNGNAIFSGITTFNQGLTVPSAKSLVIGPNYLYGSISRPTGFSGLEFMALNQYRFKCWDGGGMHQWLHVNGVGGLIDIGGEGMGVAGVNDKTPKIGINGSSHQIKMHSSAPGSSTLTERFRLSQSGFNFTGLSTHTGNFDLDGDLDVDGHTNLDNVSIAGVSTFTGLIDADGGIKVDDYLELFHYGNTNFIRPNNGSLDIITPGNNANIARFIPGNGGVELWHNASKKFNTTSTGASVTGNFEVSGQTNLTGDVTLGGTRPRLNFYDSDGNPDFAFINDSGMFQIFDQTNGGNRIQINSDGHVDILNHLDVNNGLDVTGNITATGDLDVDGHTNLDNLSVAGVSTFSDDVTFTGASSNIVFEKSSNQLKFNDSAKIRLGTDNDTNIRHDGSNMWIQNSTGYIYMDASSTAIRFISQASWASGAMAAFNNNGSVQLYYDAQQKFYTTASGINVVGTTDTDGLVVSGVSTITGNLETSTIDITGTRSIGNDALQLSFSAPEGHIKTKNTSGSPASNLAFHTTDTSGNTNRVMHLRYDGNVGIKSTAPRGRLDIQFDGAPSFITFGADADNPKIEFFRSTGGSPSHYATEFQQVLGDFVISTAASANLGSHSYSEKLRIKSNGNVGIGTDNPATKVHIYDASADPYLKIGGGGRDCGIQLDAATNFTAFRTDGANRLFVNAGADSIRFSVGGTSSSNEKLRITSDGQLNLGSRTAVSGGTASPTHFRISRSDNANAALITMGAHEYAQSSSAPGACISSNHRDLIITKFHPDFSGNSPGLWLKGNAIQMYSGSSETMRLTSGGTVNIGGNYTQTSKTLYVDGTIEATSNLTCVNQIYLSGTAPQFVFTDTNQDSDYTIKNDGGQLSFIDRTNSNATRLFVNTGGFGGDRLYISNDIVHTGDTDTKIEFGTDIINFDTGGGERLRIDNDLVNVKGCNLHVGTDSATTNYTDSNGGLTRHIEIGATGGGDALLTTHCSGYGIGYFGYEAGGDRLVIACDQGGGNNSIDFITTAGTSSGGNSDNLNGKSPRFQIRGNGGFRAEYTDGDEVHAMSNSWHGNVNYNHRGNRTLHSNGSGWGSGDGADPILVLSVANRAANSDLGDAYGIQLHSESQDNNDYGPMIGWSNRSNSGNYNTTYAAIVGQKTGQAVDTNWSSGALHFFTNKPGGYMNSTADMSINEDGYVTKPRQPAFNVTKTGGQINSNIGLVVFDDDSSFINCNIGNHYSKTGTTQGRFTAPVDGRYQINARMLTNSSTQSYTILLLQKNGATVGYIGHNHTDSWIMESGSWVLDLVENDYVTVYLQQHSGHGGYNYASFSGFLIG